VKAKGIKTHGLSWGKMDNSSKQYWDTRKQEPIVEAILKYKTAGIALDLGAGTGRDAFFLAEKGFSVTAVEIDETHLNTLRQKNELAERPLRIVKQNMLEYHPDKNSDVIVCDMVLHFLKPDEVRLMVTRMQEWTNRGGINVITAYTDKNPPGKRPYLLKTRELSRLYDRWEILGYREQPTPWFQLPGEPAPRRNHAAYLIARKV